MNITATSEKSAEVLKAWRNQGPSYYPGSWWEIRLVGWLSINATTRIATLYFKWQIGSHNWWPYEDNTHTYTVSGNGQSRSTSFALQQDRSNTYIDKSPTQSMDFGYEQDGTRSSSISISGYKCWENISATVDLTFPAIAAVTPPPTPSPEPEPTPVDPDEPSVPVVNDEDPKFYIYADDEILYSLTDEAYYVINPKLTLELNQIDSLDFTLPPTHTLYSRLNKLKTTIEVRQGKETLFRGRILNDETDFYNRKTIHCEGALGFLNDTLMPPYSAGEYSYAKDLFKNAINQHYNQAPASFPKRRLKYVRCDVSAKFDESPESEEYAQTMSLVSSLISDHGGYLKMEYYDNGETGISWLSSAFHQSSQIIDFGENILDLSQTIDATDIYTSVICLGKRNDDTNVRPSTGYVEDADAINTYGRIIRTFTYDDVESTSELQTLAKYLLAIGVQQSVTISIKAVDLHLVYPEIEKIRIGDYVRIRSTPHGIDSYFQCSRIDMDLQNPQNTTYTFGATIKALTDTTSKK